MDQVKVIKSLELDEGESVDELDLREVVVAALEARVAEGLRGPLLEVIHGTPIDSTKVRQTRPARGAANTCMRGPERIAIVESS